MNLPCFLLIIVGIIATEVKAQNLVPNPGFELFNSCPVKLGQLSKATHWFSPNGGTPEYLNTECPLNGVAPFQGKGAAGVIFFGDYPRTVEYLSTKLSSPLHKGERYVIGFSIIAEESFMYIDKIGMLLTEEDISIPEWRPFYDVPQLLSEKDYPITPELGWFEVEGEYVAKGGEEFLTIGNFFRKDAHMVLLNEFASSFSPGWVSYYYIDNVRVFSKKSSASLEKKVTINHTENDSVVLFFDFDQHELSGHSIDSLSDYLRSFTSHEGYSFQISGHTDSLGERSYNQKLSEARCLSVRNAINAQLRWQPEVHYMSFGESKLGGLPNYQERRVVIRSVKKRGPQKGPLNKD